MKRIIALIVIPVAVGLAAPAVAQQTEDEPRGGLDRFLDDFRDGMGDALGGLQGWAEDIGPAMKSFIEEMGPALSDMMDEVKDWSRYEAPEMLDNGDIIIRRKPEDPADPDAPPVPPPAEDGDSSPIDI
ncbi:hypothetical protein LA6_001406 [Marinibacterium anthonyi]|nr:hypothetical protein LA6_001406 [Marinibacterium anthonyi]